MKPWGEAAAGICGRGRSLCRVGWVAILCVTGAGCDRVLEPPTIQGGTLDPALVSLLDAARRDVLAAPELADAWGKFGQALEAAEFVEQARFCYDRAARLDPSSARWAHLLGLLQLETEPAAGLERLARAAELADPTHDASRVRLAQALVERGLFSRAIVHLAWLTNGWPGHAAAHLEWARIGLAEQRLADAAHWLTPCLTNPYTARSAALMLGQIRAREGQPELAREWVRRATGMPKPFDWPDPFQREVQELRVDRARRAERIQGLMAQGRMAEAETELAGLLASMPNDPEALLLAGRMKLQQRQCAEAEVRFREHLTAAGETVNGLTQLALSLLCQRRWSDADGVLGRVLELKPDFAQAHANRAVARSRQGDSAGAIRSYREALRCSPGEAGSHAGLAEELARSGAREEALRHVDRALEIDPNQAKARALRGRLLENGLGHQE